MKGVIAQSSVLWSLENRYSLPKAYLGPGY